MKGIIAGVVLAAAIGAWGSSAQAQAAPFTPPAGTGCETIPNPVLLSWIEKRTICDGPRYADGHWDRVRVYWIPAHSTSASSYCNDYGSCTFTPAASYDDTIEQQDKYPVSDAPGAVDTPLDGEPGWLPPGTNNYR